VEPNSYFLAGNSFVAFKGLEHFDCYSTRKLGWCGCTTLDCKCWSIDCFLETNCFVPYSLLAPNL
jgi:hypothetical protein